MEVAPLEVRKIPSKSLHAIFAADFDRRLHTLASVADKARYLFRCRVRWEKAKTKSGITVCRNCSMIGHGINNCHRKPICLMCGDAHPFDKCPLNKYEESQRVHQCVNCYRMDPESDYYHRADDSSCPARARYTEWQRAAASRNNKRQAPAAHQPFNAATWPTMPTVAAQHTGARKNGKQNKPYPSRPNTQTVQPPVFAYQSYADAASTQPQTRQPTNNFSSNACLFTTAELMNIMMTAIDRQQMRIIAELLQQCLD